MIHDFSICFEIENPLWQKVLEIFDKNEKYEKKIVKNRNLHHKFPRSFSKILGEPVDNDKDNLISLSLADHFLVHYYYYLLAKKGFRQSMATAFTFMAKKSLKYISPETAEAMAKDYNEAQKTANMYRSELGKKATISKETRQKMNENRRKIQQTDEYKRRQAEAHIGKKLTEEHKQRISNKLKGKPKTEETKKKIREVHQTDEWKRKQSESHKNKAFTDFGEKYLTHFGYSSRENIKQYKKELYFYNKYGHCSWELEEINEVHKR